MFDIGGFMKVKETYGFRKSKISKTLCGAVLGTVAAVSVAGQNVFADETTTTSKVDTTAVAGTETGNPATNLPEAQKILVMRLLKVRIMLGKQKVQSQLKCQQQMLIRP